jgi:hypothetical protein
MSEFNFRLAEPGDAEAFSRWTAANTQIDDEDKQAAMIANNPTVVWFVVEKAGVVVAFAPLYLQFTLPHLGFNPEAGAEDRKEAMLHLIDGVSAFAVQYGIREITTLSSERYLIARWALQHDFTADPRQLLKLDLNKLMAAVSKA